MKPFLIIDFDSTFTITEALDELAKIALENNPKQETIVSEIEKITKLGMEGKISFQDSLEKRLQLFSANQLHTRKLVELLQAKITPSIQRNKQFIQENKNYIYIISGGFHEFIDQVVSDFSIQQSHVLANTFIFDDKGTITGFDKTNPLSRSGGKPVVVKDLTLDGEVYVLGDGITDYQIKEQNAADYFYAFTENVRRESVVKKADREIKQFEEVITIFQ